MIQKPVLRLEMSGIAQIFAQLLIPEQQYVCSEAESKFSNYYSDENYTLKVNRNCYMLNINHTNN